MNSLRLATILAACASLATAAHAAPVPTMTATVTLPPKPPAITTTAPQIALRAANLLQPGTWAITFKDSQGHPVAAWPVTVAAVTPDGQQSVTYCTGMNGADFPVHNADLTINLAQGTISGAFLQVHPGPHGAHETAPGYPYQMAITGTVTPASADAATFKTVSGTATFTADKQVSGTYSVSMVPVDVQGLPHNGNAPQTACTWIWGNL